MITMTPDDRVWMQRALSLAERGRGAVDVVAFEIGLGVAGPYEFDCVDTCDSGQCAGNGRREFVLGRNGLRFGGKALPCLLRNGLEAGTVFCRDSVRFRSFEDDLIDDHRWKDKENLIADMGLPLLKQPIREHLAELETQLEDRLIQVNQRIASGERLRPAA